MTYYVLKSLQLGICSKNFSCKINLRATRSLSCVSGWKPFTLAKEKKNKSWMGHKPQSLQLGICLKNFCCKINLRATRSLCCVKPIHTPQMLMLAKGNYFQEEKKQGLDGILCATESSVGNLLKELFLQDQSARNKIFELCEWMKPIHATQRKLLPGRKKTSPGWDVCLIVFSWEFAQTTFDARSICEKQDLWVVWVGESHSHASDDDASQRKLMCLCTDYQFLADLKSSIFADVKTVCFGEALTSA